MTTHDNITDLAVESVSECLDAAKLLIDHRKGDGGMMGYAATLLLFSITDAIGHHLNVGTGHIRLEVLGLPQFGLDIDGQQICELKKYLKMWFRNSLTHGASIVPGVLLTPDEDGGPFEFEGGKPVMIRVPQFYKMVRRVWDDLDKTSFDSIRDTLTAKSYTEPPLSARPFPVPPVSGVFTTATTPSSGMFLVPPEET